jgi:hypothetical protein
MKRKSGNLPITNPEDSASLGALKSFLLPIIRR